jgi:hypothetical protein
MDATKALYVKDELLLSMDFKTLPMTDGVSDGWLYSGAVRPYRKLLRMIYFPTLDSPVRCPQCFNVK